MTQGFKWPSKIVKMLSLNYEIVISLYVWTRKLLLMSLTYLGTPQHCLAFITGSKGVFT